MYILYSTLKMGTMKARVEVRSDSLHAMYDTVHRPLINSTDTCTHARIRIPVVHLYYCTSITITGSTATVVTVHRRCAVISLCVGVRE